MIFLTRQTNKANLNYVSIRRELKCVALPQADSKRMSEYAMKRSKCFTDLDQLWPYIKAGPSLCASVQPCNDNDQPVQLPLLLHRSLLFKLILTTGQHLHAVNTPKCTHTHTLVYFQTGIHTRTPTETRSCTCLYANTHVCSFAIDVFTKWSLCKPNKVGSSAIYFQPRRRFLSPSSPSPPRSPF